jgi:hypothetical protein
MSDESAHRSVAIPVGRREATTPEIFTKPLQRIGIEEQK